MKIVEILEKTPSFSTPPVFNFDFLSEYFFNLDGPIS